MRAQVSARRCFPSSTYFSRLCGAQFLPWLFIFKMNSKLFPPPPRRWRRSGHQYHRNGCRSWPGTGKTGNLCQDRHRGRSDTEGWKVSFSIKSVLYGWFSVALITWDVLLCVRLGFRWTTRSWKWMGSAWLESRSCLQPQSWRIHPASSSESSYFSALLVVTFCVHWCYFGRAGL